MNSANLAERRRNRWSSLFYCTFFQTRTDLRSSPVNGLLPGVVVIVRVSPNEVYSSSFLRISPLDDVYLAILCVPVQGFFLDAFDSLRMDLGSIVRNKPTRSWACTGDAKSAVTVLQPIRNLLRFLQIDSEVFSSRTLGEPFDGAQCNPGWLAIFSDALQYDVP